MSVDYNVAVHSANWPSSAALQGCIDRLRYPVTLQNTGSEPFLLRASGTGLRVHFRNRAVELEASAVKLSPTRSYGYHFARSADEQSVDGDIQVWAMRSNEDLKPADIGEDLRRLGARNVRFGYGDYVLTFSFHSNVDEIRAGS